MNDEEFEELDERIGKYISAYNKRQLYPSWDTLSFAMAGMCFKEDFFNSGLPSAIIGFNDVSSLKFKSYIDYCIDHDYINISCDNEDDLIDIECFIIDLSDRPKEIVKDVHDMYIRMIKRTKNISIKTLKIILLIAIAKEHTPVVQYLLQEYPMLNNIEYEIKAMERKDFDAPETTAYTYDDIIFIYHIHNSNLFDLINILK
jgi:hypothetical protein